MPESIFDLNVRIESIHSFLPTTTPTRQPAIEWPFDSEFISSATSRAPSASMIEIGAAALRMKLYGLSCTIRMLCRAPKSTIFWNSSIVGVWPVGMLG